MKFAKIIPGRGEGGGSKLATRIAIAFVLGALAGLLIGPRVVVLQPLGEVFIRLLRMLVLPIVVLTLLAGLTAPAPVGIGRLSVKTVACSLLFSLCATLIGLAVAVGLHPGRGMPLPAHAAPQAEILKLSLRDFLLGIIPENVIAAIVRGDLLAVIFFTILLGLAIARLRNSPSHSSAVESLHRGLEALRQAVTVILGWVMAYAPIATFALVATLFGEARAGVATQFLRAIVAVYAGHALIGLLCLTALRLAGVSPLWFLRGIKAPLLTAFITGSSAAALPVEIEAAAHELRLDRRISSLILSLGTGIHKIGTAVHLAVMVVFAVNAVGMPAGFEQYSLLGLLVLAGAVGTPPISGGAYVVLGFIFEQAGLPLSLIGVLLAIPLLAKFSTPLNSLGRLTVTVLLSPRQCYQE